MDSFLITSVRVFDGVSVIYETGHVLFSRGVITLVSAQPPQSLPENCTVISGAGCTLLPGLIDAHVHVYNEVSGLRNSLSYGVTTVLDLHNETPWADNVKRAARERNDVADILSSYNAATIPKGWPEDVFRFLDPSEENEKRIAAWPRVTSVESAKQFVDEAIAKGADFIKIMQETGEGFNAIPVGKTLPTPSISIQRALVAGAQEHRVLCVAHAMNHGDTFAVLQAGVDGVVHALMDKTPTPKLIKAFKESGAFLVPTLTVTASNCGEEGESRDNFARGLESPHRENLCTCTQFARAGSSVQAGYAQVRALKAVGVDIVCGTDTSPGFRGMHFGLSMHHELWLYVERCGFTPIEVLVSATSVSARRWRLLDRGTIELGKKADLLLVRGDPTKDIAVSKDIEAVWRNGVKFEKQGAH